MQDIEQNLADTHGYIQEYIDRIMPKNKGKLYDAMRYSSLSKGKGIRGYLLIESAKLFDIKIAQSLPIATALELIHTYSLIHDDLPSMDNDPIRRGKASCHVEFDEATAILAGDALLTFAFELISSERVLFSSTIKVEVIYQLAKAIGPSGMAGGQMLDILFEEKEVSIDEIIAMEKMKTADFIASACMIGGILAGASQHEKFILNNFGTALGLAFQIVDDILDVEGCEKQAGKKLRKDKEAGKSTLVDCLGIDQARLKANNFIDYAIAEIKRLNLPSDPLISLAKFVLSREA